MKYVQLLNIADSLTSGTSKGLERKENQTTLSGGIKEQIYAPLPLDQALIKKIKISKEQGGHDIYLIYKDKYIIGKGKEIINLNDEGKGSFSLKKEDLMQIINLYYSNKHYENNYQGLKIQLKGRLKGALRARRVVKFQGSLNMQCFSSSLHYHRKDIYTKWGILGVKVYINKTPK